MGTPALEPTVTQRVRAFLASHGAPIKPWSSLEETYTTLYSLLRRRRDDPTFWEPLAQLLQEVIDSAVDPTRTKRLPAPQAELLASWDVEKLVDSLKAALPPSDDLAGGNGGAPPDRLALGQFTAKLSTAMLGGFLLLGFVAAGCSDDGPSEGAGGSGGSAGGTPTNTYTTSTSASTSTSTSTSTSGRTGPWYEGCSLDDTSILWTTIDESSIDDHSKANLCDCFAGLNTSWEDGLTELFESETPENIASALYNLLNCCMDGETLNSDYATQEAAFLDGSLCESQPIYKGVSFPR